MIFKRLCWLTLGIAFIALQPASSPSMAKEGGATFEREIAKSELLLIPTQGIWTYRGRAFTGQALSYHRHGQLAERQHYVDGKKDGSFELFYETGALKKQGHYVRNRLDGAVMFWSQEGILLSESHYENGEVHGEQRQFYASGKLFKVRHLEHGLEVGMQRAFLENGKVYVNYEAKNGRRFGLHRSTPCYELEDEVVKL